MTTDEMFWKVLLAVASLVLGILGYLIRESYEGMIKALDTLKDSVNEGDKAIAVLKSKIEHVEKELTEMKDRLQSLEERIP